MMHIGLILVSTQGIFLELVNAAVVALASPPISNYQNRLVMTSRVNV